MKKKIVNVFLMALLATATVGTVVSCKDYEEDNYADLNGKITNVEGLNNALEERVSALETAKEEMNKEIQSLKDQLGSVDDDATKTTIYGRIASLEALVSTINGQIGEINKTLNTHGGKIAELYSILDITDGVSNTIEDIYYKIGENEKAIQGLLKITPEDTAAWHKAVQDASAAYSLAKTNDERIKKLEDMLGMLGDYADFKNNVTEALTDAEGNWINVTEFVDDKLSGYVTSTDLDEQIQDIKDGYTQMGEDYKAELDSFKDSISTVTAKLEETTRQLNDRLGLVESFVNKLVTSVIIQGTENPVFGTFALPANISSNVLAAYYGDVNTIFPTSDPSDYVDATQALSGDEVKILLANGKAVSYAGRVVSGLKEDGKTVEAGNAGTLYLTVNPNTADLEGAAPLLVNSQDVESGVKLSSLDKTDKVLNFGYTRSAADNGFYAAKATVGVDDVEGVAPRISYEQLKGLKDQIKDAVDAVRNKGNVNVTGLVYSVYSLCSNILDANAVKFPWSTTDINGNPVEHATYSQYSLAATAVHPLSYGFMYGQHYDEFPGINKMEDIIGGIFDKVQDALPNVDVDDVNIHIDVKDFTFDHVTYPDGSISTTVEVSGSYTDDNGVEHELDIDPIEVDITKKVEQAVNDALGGAAGDVSEYINTIVDQLNGQVAQINDMIDELRSINEIGNQISDIEDQIYDYLNRAEDYLLKVVNNANNLLQPMMLAKTSDSYVVLSRSKSAPTKFAATSYNDATGIYLRPTSYTAEILAPAFKKVVGVVNVYDKDGKVANNAAVLRDNVNSASSNFCKVIDGQENTLQLKGLKEDKVYEIVYTAVDFSGKIVVKRFFVELV